MKSEVKTYVTAEIQEKSVKYVVWSRENEKAHIIDVRAQEKKLPEEFDELMITFSPELLKAQIRTQIFQRDKPEFIISSSEEKTIVKAMEEKAESVMKASIVESSGILSDDFQMINMSLRNRKIDGYAVPHLKGFHGKKIESTLVGLFLLKTIYNKYLHDKERIQAEHVSHAIEAFVEKKGKLGVYVMMGNRVTQIIGIQGEGIAYFSEIRFGKEDFVRTIEHALGMQETTAYELLEQYAKGEVSASLRQKLHTMLAMPTQQCQSMLSKELDNIEIVFAPDIFLFGEGSDLPEMRECMEEVIVLTPKDINTFDAARGLDDPRFTSLFLLVNAKLYQNKKGL